MVAGIYINETRKIKETSEKSKQNLTLIGLLYSGDGDGSRSLQQNGGVNAKNQNGRRAS
jgi:hypothetical protein